MGKPLFPLGQIVSTHGALALLAEGDADPLSLLARHQRGDWGDLCAADRAENDYSVREGFRILSAYKLGNETVWIITEADRSATTLLLPSEY